MFELGFRRESITICSEILKEDSLVFVVTFSERINFYLCKNSRGEPTIAHARDPMREPNNSRWDSNKESILIPPGILRESLIRLVLKNHCVYGGFLKKDPFFHAEIFREILCCTWWNFKVKATPISAEILRENLINVPLEFWGILRITKLKHVYDLTQEKKEGPNVSCEESKHNTSIVYKHMTCYQSCLCMVDLVWLRCTY